MIIFSYIDEQKIKSLNQIKKEDLTDKIKMVKKSIKIYEYENDINEITDNSDDKNYDHIMIKRKGVVLDDKTFDILLANYIDREYSPIGINGVYEVLNSKWQIKRYIYKVLINLVRMFDKKHLRSYPIVILNNKNISRKLISFMPEENIVVKINNIKKESFINEINNLNKISFLSMVLYLYFSASISINMIYSLINFNLSLIYILSFIITTTVYVVNAIIRKILFNTFSREKSIFKYLILLIYIFVIIYIIYIRIKNIITRLKT